MKRDIFNVQKNTQAYCLSPSLYILHTKKSFVHVHTRKKSLTYQGINHFNIASNICRIREYHNAVYQFKTKNVKYLQRKQEYKYHPFINFAIYLSCACVSLSFSPTPSLSTYAITTQPHLFFSCSSSFLLSLTLLYASPHKYYLQPSSLSVNKKVFLQQESISTHYNKKSSYLQRSLFQYHMKEYRISPYGIVVQQYRKKNMTL